MNHKEFVKKWIGKSYEETHELWVQCVWGWKIYARERGWSIWSFGWSAWNGWLYWLPFNSEWKRVEYKKWMFPPEWALVFWNEKRCKYWHVAIANRLCNQDVLRCLDQNGTGKGDPFTHRFYDYKNIVGWYEHI